MRRNTGTAQSVQTIGDVEFDAVSGHLRVDGKTINLRNRELRLIELLIGAKGQVFSKQKLVDRLFSYDDDVSENAIEVYVGRLRKHLEGSKVRIVTLRGLGYRLDHDS